MPEHYKKGYTEGKKRMKRTGNSQQKLWQLKRGGRKHTVKLIRGIKFKKVKRTKRPKMRNRQLAMIERSAGRRSI